VNEPVDHRPRRRVPGTIRACRDPRRGAPDLDAGEPAGDRACPRRITAPREGELDHGMSPSAIECSCRFGHRWYAAAEVSGPELMRFREELGEYCPACGQPDHELAEDDERIAEDIDEEQLRALAAVYIMEWEDLDLVWRDRHWLPRRRR
jgi:hypothetical protein